MDKKEELFKEVEEIIGIYEGLIGHIATRTRQMIDKYGVIDSLSMLMLSPNLQQGFIKLRDSNQLDKSFESIVIKYREYFGSDVFNAAQWRIDHPYDLF